MKSNKKVEEKNINIVSLDNITALQKIALEGEIAKALSTARHDAEILYRYYTILKRAPKEISYLLVQIVRDMTDIKQETLDRVMLEASLDVVPLWIWTQKTAADLKLSLKLACADSIGDASMDRKSLQKKLIKSAFVYYCRSVAMMCPTAALTLCQYIINEESIDLNFLEDACFALIPEIKELKEDESVEDIVTEDIIHTMFDISKVLSYKVETEVLERRNKPVSEEDRALAQQLDELKDGEVKQGVNTGGTQIYAGKVVISSSATSPADELSQVLKRTIDEILKEREGKEHKENGKFVVVKEYDGCDVVTPLRECKTEEEAQKFIDSMEKQFPELLKTVRFRIRRS